jgi:TonB family protein
MRQCRVASWRAVLSGATGPAAARHNFEAMASPRQTHYEVLGVSPAASAREIRAAYRQRARDLHPDRNPHRQEWATLQFRALSEAFGVLKDPAKRRAYDASLGGHDAAGPAADARGERQIALARVERLFFDGRLADAYREVTAVCARYPNDAQCRELRAAVACAVGTNNLASGQLNEAERYLLEAQAATRTPATQARIRTALDSLASARAEAAGGGRSWWRRIVLAGAISAALGGIITYVVMIWPTHRARTPATPIDAPPAVAAPRADTRPRPPARAARRSAPRAASPSPDAPPSPEPADAVTGPTVTVRVMSRGGVPQKLRGREPVYPEPAVAAGVQGTVLVEVTIRPDGRVADTRVIQSIPSLDAAVTGAIGRWVFARNASLGEGTSLTLMLAVEFRL